MLLRLREQGSLFPGGAAAVLRAADKIFMSHVALLLVSLGPLPPRPVINGRGSAATLSVGSVAATRRFIS